MKTINTFYPTKPHAKQAEVLNDDSRFKALVAGRKWRKTSLIISWLTEGALTTNLSYPYIAPSKVQAKNIVWDDHIQRLLGHFKAQGLPYKTNEVDLSVSFPGKGKLQLFGVENKEALRGISNWGAVGCDEYDDWAEDIWPLIIRPNLIPNRSPAIIAGTPKGKRGLWRLSQDPKFKFFHYRSQDNPDIPENELKELLEEYKSYGEDYYKQEILAEFVKPVGVVYKEFKEEKQWLKFDYDPNLPVHVSWDFGINDPTVMIWFQPFNDELRVIDYYEASDVDIKHFVQILNGKPYRTPSLHTGDTAGNARSLNTGKSVIEELSDEGIYVRTSQIPNIGAQVRQAHKFIPMLRVNKSNPNCDRFVDILNNYRYPEKSAKLLNQSNEIPIHDGFSHGARAFEYYCWNTTQEEPLRPKRIKKHDPITGRLLS